MEKSTISQKRSFKLNVYINAKALKETTGFIATLIPEDEDYALILKVYFKIIKKRHMFLLMPYI